VRCLIRIPVSRPIPEYADSMLEAWSFVDQVWLTLPRQPSYGSFFAGRYGNPPDEVQPPSEEEN